MPKQNPIRYKSASKSRNFSDRLLGAKTVRPDDAYKLRPGPKSGLKERITNTLLNSLNDRRMSRDELQRMGPKELMTKWPELKGKRTIFTEARRAALRKYDASAAENDPGK
jgi:hypothetical protein